MEWPNFLIKQTFADWDAILYGTFKRGNNGSSEILGMAGKHSTFNWTCVFRWIRVYMVVSDDDLKGIKLFQGQQLSQTCLNQTGHRGRGP